MYIAPVLHLAKHVARFSIWMAVNDCVWCRLSHNPMLQTIYACLYSYLWDRHTVYAKWQQEPVGIRAILLCVLSGHLLTFCLEVTVYVQLSPPQTFTPVQYDLFIIRDPLSHLMSPKLHLLSTVYKKTGCN